MTSTDDDARTPLTRALDLLARRAVERGEDQVRESLACDEADEIIGIAAALRYKTAVADRPRLVGLLGCASVGKSLVFNNLAGRSIARVSYKSHTSQGAVALFHRDDWTTITRAEAAQEAPFGLFAASEIVSADTEGLTGTPDRLLVVVHEEEDRRGIALLDLPDISSVPAALDPVARRFLPWLDGVLLVTSCDTLNAREYDRHLSRLDRLGVWRWGVLNNLDDQDLETEDATTPASAKERFENLGASDTYTLPYLDGSNEFRQLEDARDFAALRASLRGEGIEQLIRAETDGHAGFLVEVLAAAPPAMRAREDALAGLGSRAGSLIESAVKRPPEIVAIEDLVGPERRGDLRKVGYNPYRLLRTLKEFSGRALNWFKAGALEATDDEPLKTNVIEERYRRFLVEFEQSLRQLYGRHELIRPLRSSETPVLPEPMAEDMEVGDRLTALIERLRAQVHEFLEKAVAEFGSAGGKTKRVVYYSVLSASVMLSLVDIFVAPGVGVAIGSGIAAAAQVIYPELRKHMNAFQPILTEFQADLGQLCRHHLQQIAEGYGQAADQALPTDAALREAIEEAAQ